MGEATVQPILPPEPEQLRDMAVEHCDGRDLVHDDNPLRKSGSVPGKGPGAPALLSLLCPDATRPQSLATLSLS